jgi:hypothetical protein
MSAISFRTSDGNSAKRSLFLLAAMMTSSGVLTARGRKSATRKPDQRAGSERTSGGENLKTLERAET